jgi:phage/plasmid primase-like uncharacterized protein
MQQTKEAARGRWKSILPQLGVSRKILSGRNQPCPFCGGRDRFRFSDHDNAGKYYCNQCGHGDGFDLLMKLHGWTLKETADKIDEVLGIDARKVAPKKIEERPAFQPRPGEDSFEAACRKADEENARKNPSAPKGREIPRSTKMTAVWLREHHPERLDDWLQDRPEVREWLLTELSNWALEWDAELRRMYPKKESA